MNTPTPNATGDPGGPADLELAENDSERGQGLVEYAMILMLIAIVLIVALQVLGTKTTGLYSNISNGLGA